MYIKLIKKKEYHLFLYYLNGRIVRRIMAFIRHFRLFSKKCPSCNGFKENGKKHSINDCIQTLLKRSIKDFNKKGSIER